MKVFHLEPPEQTITQGEPLKCEVIMLSHLPSVNTKLHTKRVLNQNEAVLRYSYCRCSDVTSIKNISPIRTISQKPIRIDRNNGYLKRACSACLKSLSSPLTFSYRTCNSSVTWWWCHADGSSWNPRPTSGVRHRRNRLPNMACSWIPFVCWKLWRFVIPLRWPRTVFAFRVSLLKKVEWKMIHKLVTYRSPIRAALTVNCVKRVCYSLSSLADTRILALNRKFLKE